MDSLHPLAGQTPGSRVPGWPQILLVEPDPEHRQRFRVLLSSQGYDVALAADAQAGLERLQAGNVDLAIVEFKLPGPTGLDLLRAARTADPTTEVLMTTTFCTVEEAVQAMKNGASDFLTKPFQRAQFMRMVREALERRWSVVERRLEARRLEALFQQDDKLIGVSPIFHRMKRFIEEVAASSATILIQGENGTGKEMVARAIHDRSLRRSGPFVAVDCRTSPETLDSELFGSEKGVSRFGAIRTEGRLDLAAGGTLFLEEIAALPPAIQRKILGVLQAGEFERAGSGRTLKADVRIISATNQNLAQLVQDKHFREDLFYRLNVITVTVPPLRERCEDIALLAQYFLRVYAAKNNRSLEDFSDEAMACLGGYAWPGNVGELESVVERAVVLTRGAAIEASSLPSAVVERSVMLARERSSTAEPDAEPEGILRIRIGTPLAEIEQRVLEETLRFAHGNRTVTARLLGVDPKTVFRKLRQVEEGDDESSRRST